MSMMLWDLGRPDDPFLQRYEHHTEFALGVDFNLFVEGQIATCAWDERTLSDPRCISAELTITQLPLYNRRVRVRSERGAGRSAIMMIIIFSPWSLAVKQNI